MRRSSTTSALTRSTRWSSSWRSRRSSGSTFRTRTPRRSPASKKRSSTSNRTARRSSSGFAGTRHEHRVGGPLSRRVVVTGIGLVSPLGIGTEANWDALCAGRSGIGPITRFDATQYSARIAGEVKDFDPLQFIEKKDVKKMDVFIQLAIAAAQYAMDDAVLSVTEDLAPRVGVFIASGIGGFSTI